MKSNLPDADMQGAPAALMRAALRAREIARQTNTPLVFMRDGVVVKEMVTDDDIEKLTEGSVRLLELIQASTKQAHNALPEALSVTEDRLDRLNQGIAALSKTLLGQPTTVSYPLMPVTVKTPAAPLCLLSPAVGVAGEMQPPVCRRNGISWSSLMRSTVHYGRESFISRTIMDPSA